MFAGPEFWCIFTEDYSAAVAYELISQFNTTSSNFGVVHSMVFVLSKTTLTLYCFP
jgi:hypothetical protein